MLTAACYDDPNSLRCCDQRLPLYGDFATAAFDHKVIEVALTLWWLYFFDSFVASLMFFIISPSTIGKWGTLTFTEATFASYVIKTFSLNIQIFLFKVLKVGTS